MSRAAVDPERERAPARVDPTHEQAAMAALERANATLRGERDVLEFKRVQLRARVEALERENAALRQRVADGRGPAASPGRPASALP